jgi:hypothetical protein
MGKQVNALPGVALTIEMSLGNWAAATAKCAANDL